jgi:capsular exopolysaccharide synthesis family protein
MDQIQARPAVQDQPAPVVISTPGVKQRTVADALQKADTQRAQAQDSQHPLATVGSVARNPSLNGYAEQVVVHHDRGSLITEQYRAIRTQILARGRNRRIQIHAITSSAPEEGKSVTTLNLGMAFSELRNQKTLIIEGDLRKPSFGALLHREASPGLLHLLRGEVDELDKIIHPTVYDNLQFIPAGDRDTTASTELLSSPRMAQILDRLRDRYDHIFIDTPPVITVTDPAILGALADETLLVVRLNRTPAEVVDRAKRLLRAANCEVAGVILTHQTIAPPKYLYRYS